MTLWEGPSQTGMNPPLLSSHASTAKALSAQLQKEVAKWYALNPPDPYLPGSYLEARSQTNGLRSDTG